MAGLFIMGGSTYYTLLLLQSLKAAALLPRFDRIALFGRDAARLELVAQAGSTLIDGAVPLIPTRRIEDCHDPAYDLIFNQMRFGGLSARDRDEKIAIDIGLPADETIGIVGVSNAVRTIIGMQSYLPALAAKQSPYTFVNFTNPCSILCQYVTDRLDVPVIGVCDYPAFMRSEIAAALGIAPRHIALEYFGLNHFGFIHGVKAHGDDVMAQVRAIALPFVPPSGRYSPWLTNISWAFVFERAAIVSRQRAAANRAATLLSIEAECDGLLAAGERDPAAYLAVLGRRRCDWFNLAVSPVLARLTGATDEAVFVNCAASDPFDLGLPNTVVESGAKFEDARFVDLALPATVRASGEFRMVGLMKRAETMLLDGILAHDGEGVIAACLMNPMIGSLDDARRYFERLRTVDTDIAQLWPEALP